MDRMKLVFLLFLLIVFLSGIYVVMYYNYPDKPTEKKEGMDNEENKQDEPNCPNLLVQKGNMLLLYNSNLPLIEGQNPLPFFNLDEYINYLEIQRNRGVICPVLYLQQENNTQGDYVYRMRPGPFDLQGGLPQINDVANAPRIHKYVDSSDDNHPYNANNYYSFDPYGQHVGVYTEIDRVHDSTSVNKISDNPMDPNWAGVTYTQQMVDSGKYVENNISKPILFQPKVAFEPGLAGPMPPPVDVL